jgi:hypothetical protein
MQEEGYLNCIQSFGLSTIVAAGRGGASFLGFLLLSRFKIPKYRLVESELDLLIHGFDITGLRRVWF